MINSVLYKTENGERLLTVPIAMQQEVTRQVYEGGHFGWRGVEYQIRASYWFPNVRTKIQLVVDSCVRCLLVERKRGKAEGFLRSLPKEETPLETYHIGHLGPIPSTKKSYSYILVVVDVFTKFIWLYATKSKTAEEIVSRLRKQAAVFENPRRILSDRKTTFNPNTFREYCEGENIEHVLTTVGVPRSNNQVERMNRSIIALVTKLAMSKP